MEVKSIPGIDMAAMTYDMNKIQIVGESGKIYRPTVRLAAGRMTYWEVTWFKAKFAMNPSDFMKVLMEMRGHCKGNDLYEVSVQINKLLDPSARIADMKPNPIFGLVALFCNADGEDVTVADDDMINEKITDWRRYDTDQLFFLAGILTPALLKDYVENTVDISAIMEAMRKVQAEVIHAQGESVGKSQGTKTPPSKKSK